MVTACHCGRIQPCSVHPKRKRSSSGHWGAAYRAERDRLVPAWTADPTTRCHLCGGLGHGPDDPWEPDHDQEADAGGGLGTNLQPAHRSCNRAKGARYKAAKVKMLADERAAAHIRATQELIDSRR